MVISFLNLKKKGTIQLVWTLRGLWLDSFSSLTNSNKKDSNLSYIMNPKKSYTGTYGKFTNGLLV
jgi:hypothetical protein